MQTPRPRANQDMPGFRIAHGIGGEILHDAAQHLRVRHHPEARLAASQADPFVDRKRQQPANHGIEDLVEIDGLNIRPQRAGLQSRQIEDGTQQIFDDRQGLVDLRDERLARLAILHLGQRRQGQSGSLQRL